MALDYEQFNAGIRFYCTTAEVGFGPVMPDEETAIAFHKYLGDDPRKFAGAVLAEKWKRFLNPQPYSETAAMIDLGKRDYEIWAGGDQLSNGEYRRRVAAYQGLDSGRQCATPDCGDEPDEGATHCPACLRQDARQRDEGWMPGLCAHEEHLRD